MKRISLFIVLIMFVLQLVAQSSRYAESSVLSVGDWYKIQVEQSGIHKITYEQLVEMGVKNPANVSVFGYGGAQLPEAFSKPYIDDLPQLSIYMEKGTDGVFGKGDYILCTSFDSRNFRIVNGHIFDKMYETIKGIR